jgi:hypothetical protein
MTSKTTFAQWREETGLSIEETATVLGLGRTQVCVLLRGFDGSGRPAVPRDGTRKLMSATSAGIELRPWALSDQELAAQKAVRRQRILAQRRTFEVAA